MSTASEFEQSCRDQITILFISEILNRLGVIEAGMVLNNVAKKVDAEQDEEVKQRLQVYIADLKASYMEDSSSTRSKWINNR
ncbi:hypothetical protein [Rouxiella chamberiensis]|uniref:Uncharacterized protein n=1 Tax=Rouxiella chamberiensis TaxID=1513468 RepID=A0ABY7HTA5_9GAMM|nr:hypothetical protein [Rouxiella chamberiensis]WAT02217.1 hypothetical protein O1V66_06100 [Rouxiella chamberiensis]